MKLSSFRDIALKKLGSEVYHEIEAEANLIAKNVLHMQTDMSKSLRGYMEKTGEGFNDIQSKLGVFSNKLNSVLKGQGNFTLKTIGEVGALLGKKTTIIFE